ncbi:hypothetical protein [Leifsonia poae]|uniref:hypothetical protein n=1 Tax=Leifsonia poae TaxID=110933 RepID=UPI003D66C158
MTVDLRLVVPAAVIWSVCGVVVGLPEQAWLLAAVAWALAGAVAIGAVMAGRRRHVRAPHDRSVAGRAGLALRIGWMAASLSVIGAASALGAIATDVPRRAPDALRAAAATGAGVTLAVRTDSSPQSISSAFDGRSRWMWRGTALSATIGDRRFDLDAPVSIIATASAQEVGRVIFGGVAVVAGTLRPAEPGESTSFIAVARDAPRLGADPPFWSAWTAQLRQGLAAGAARTLVMVAHSFPVSRSET